MKRIILTLAVMLNCAGLRAFDLGGPCVAKGEKAAFDVPDWRLLEKTEKAGQWDRAVELHKLAVRETCDNASRWYGLAEALVRAGSRREAAAALEEMEKRSTVFRPSYLERLPALSAFIRTEEFKATGYGGVFSRRLAAAEERRKGYIRELGEMDEKDRPGELYVAKGACPFECCTYRQWTVKADTPLVDAPGSGKVTGKAVKGTRVRGVTGEVRLRPVPVGVTVNYPPMEKGEVIFLLDYVGEGSYKYWHKGALASQDMSDLEEYCLVPDPYCWGEYVYPDRQKTGAVWWVEIELPDGATGWSDKPENFGNKDSCG